MFCKPLYLALTWLLRSLRFCPFVHESPLNSTLQYFFHFQIAMDGGSPLACLRGKDQYELAGLVTFGTSCAHDRSPSLFTNVSKHVRWIKENYENMKKRREN